MAFQSLSEKLQEAFKGFKSKGKLSEKDLKAGLREVRLALLEADVNFKVVKEFISKVEEKALGDEIMKSLTPGQQVIKIVQEELVELMGSTQSKLTKSNKPPSIYILVGLQGAGKTTTVGKLAGLLKSEGRSPLLVACDVYRPAAITQLEVVAKHFKLPVFSLGDKEDPVKIAIEGVEEAKVKGNDVVIIDTAGRLHIDEALMDELKAIKAAVNPQEILLTVDSMTGQDAVNVAESFNKELGIDGIILTKLDGDTRGGAALSVRTVTSKPIKYIGTGEKLSDLEAFHPERMVSRILGMGDVLSLIEKAELVMDEEAGIELEKKIRANEFNFEDFLEQLAQVKKMGPLKQLLEMVPGMSGMDLDAAGVDDNAMDHVEAIIRSMTAEERLKPSVLNGSRKKRIAKGSGRTIQEVNKLVKQFEEMKKMMKQFTGGSSKKKKRGMFPFK